jgi:hypothetical protein
MVAGIISTIVIASAVALTLFGLKTYYQQSDYLTIEGQTRRLTDDLTESGTLSNDLAVFNDISDLTQVNPGGRGDCLMFYKRAADGTGNITSFVCYYLARTPPVAGSGPISLWRIKGTPGTLTASPGTALTNYSRSVAKNVSGTIFSGTLPRATPAPPAVREGVFTNDGFRLTGSSPTVLINLPASFTARGSSAYQAKANITFAVSPRH